MGAADLAATPGWRGRPGYIYRWQYVCAERDARP